MRAPNLFLSLASLFLSLPGAFAADKVVHAAARPNRLFCRTGLENRPANQALELYLQYHLPLMYEPEDPTMPYGRQVMVLKGRPVVQLHFRKAPEAAGDSGEKLEPMTCAFAKRAVAAHEPNHVQIYLPVDQVHWISQGIGQRPGPKQLSFERAVVVPAGDWAFASQFDKIFTVDLEDQKNFISTQIPKGL